MSLPLASLICPFTGSDSFKFFIQSVQQQSLSSDLFELIIIEDGVQIAESVVKLFNLKVQTKIHQLQRPAGFKGHSAGLCRNAGVNLSRGEYLVFIDSDCIIHPRCLEKHLEILRIKKEFAVCGYASELPSIHHNKLEDGYYESFDALERFTRKDSRLTISENSDTKDVCWDLWYTCNSSVHRDYFNKTGGFDISGFRCHDMELAYRLNEHSVTFQYESTAKVIHIEHYRSIKARSEQREGWKMMATNHPELENYVFDKLLESERHQLEVIENCENNFQIISSNLNGIRNNFQFILPPGTHIESVLKILNQIPFLVEYKKEYAQFNLGLNRNCWDYNFFLPTITNSSSPQISILIPFFNTGEFIVRSVISVLTQTIQNFEIILIDDCSNDDTINYLNPFMTDPRIRIYSNPGNQGLSSSLNLGLEKSCADIILHLDSDDWLEKNALEVVLNAFESDPEIGAVFGSAVLHINDEKISEKGHPINSFEGYFAADFCQAPRAYRKKCLYKVGGWNISDAHSGRFYEDRLILATISKFYKISFLDEPLYNCLVSTNSLSRKNYLLTASVKLSILWDQANKHGYFIDYRLNGSMLKATLKRSQLTINSLRWSVVIPYYQWSELLFLSIKSWLEINSPELIGEIIIVNDGAGENLEHVQALDPERIKIFKSEISRGPSWARNMGASLAQYEMLFFSDFDHIVPPDVLQKHALRHLQEQADSCVIGCVFGRRALTVFNPGIQKRHLEKVLNMLRLNDQFENVAAIISQERKKYLIDKKYTSSCWTEAQKFSFTDYWLEQWGKIILKFGERLDHYPHKWCRISTGSMSIKKETFLKTEGFDENLKSMEDWELGIRLQKTGINIICAPEAEPFHQVHPIDENRNTNNNSACEYIKVKHADYINNLIADNSEFAPPAIHFFKNKIFDSKEIIDPSIKVEHNSSDNHCLITFDDGPHPVGTPLILEVLKKYSIKAIFFVLGYNCRQYPEILKKIVDDGHEIGIHSWIHTPSEQFTSAEILEMLSKTVQTIRAIANIVPAFSRPPYGKLSPSYKSACKNLNLVSIGWDVSSDDWSANSEKDIIIKLATQEIKNKVLLFHDGSGNPEYTAKALDWLLQLCRTENIKPVLPNEFNSFLDLPDLPICNPYL